MKTGQFSAVAKWLHWLVAILMISILSVAFSFAFEAPEERVSAIPVHAAIGLMVLALTFVRLAYRRVVPPPALPETTPPMVTAGARIGHWLLYALVFYQVALGIWMAAISPVDIRLFSGPNLSALAPANPQLLDVLRQWHFAGACVFALALLGHVSAALWHHFKLRDDVLIRMLPFSALWQREAGRGALPAWRFPSQVFHNWPKRRIS